MGRSQEKLQLCIVCSVEEENYVSLVYLSDSLYEQFPFVRKNERFNDASGQDLFCHHV